MSIKRIFVAFVCIVAFVSNVSSMENNEIAVSDSILFSQIYNVKDFSRSNELCFKTLERTVQSHEGQSVYEAEREVEYKVKKSDRKVVIKRKVVSSNISVLCDDREVLDVYPNVTNKLLSGVLTPRKIKMDTQTKIPVIRKSSQPDNESGWVMDKLALYPNEGDSFKGVSVRFESFTEELVYSSEKFNCFDLLKEINTNVSIELIDKSEMKHQIQLSETIKFVW